MKRMAEIKGWAHDITHGNVKTITAELRSVGATIVGGTSNVSVKLDAESARGER